MKYVRINFINQVAIELLNVVWKTGEQFGIQFIRFRSHSYIIWDEVFKWSTEQ